MEVIDLVIKIPEEIRLALINNIQLSQDQQSICDSCIQQAIINGTPLPKGHGKLFDEKEINTVVNDVFNAHDKYSPKTFLDVIHNQCIETIGADKAESEE